uniref:hypothetical protein n=1 Tax=uncultured Planktosalinus sp. TaxID=1810935 RepID=UPI0030DD1519
VQNGELSPIPFFNNEVIWEPLYRVEDDFLNFETVVFSNKVTNSLGHTFYMGIHVGMGPSSECGYESGANWDRNSYYLLKFPDSSVDTLRVQDQKKVFSYPEYTLYLNDVALNYHFYPQNYITIQK